MDNRKITHLGKMPDPFLKNDGTRMTPDEWWQNRDEIRKFVVDMEFGGMPPRPEVVKFQRLTQRTRSGVFYKITAGSKERQLTFNMEINAPMKRDGYIEREYEEGEKYPVLLTGDGCYHNMETDLIQAVVNRGYITASFNRLDLAVDMRDCREGGLYDVYPDYKDFTAISAWAWGYMVCMDVFEKLPFIDDKEVGITGHSRGGKTVLLAGAMDDRIKYVCPNCSGCHGAASHRTQVTNQGAEKWRGEMLEDIAKNFPHWMPEKLKPYIGRENELPYDMHYFGALIAPRYYFQIEGHQDYWSNPIASRQTIMAVQACHEYLGYEGHAVQWLRSGGHAHKFPHFMEFVEFMDCVRKGEQLLEQWVNDPFPGVEKNFDW